MEPIFDHEKLDVYGSGALSMGPLKERGFSSLGEPYKVLNLSNPKPLEMSADMRVYLQGLGVRTLLLDRDRSGSFCLASGVVLGPRLD
jgi:hypothetical protein